MRRAFFVITTIPQKKDGKQAEPLRVRGLLRQTDRRICRDHGCIGRMQEETAIGGQAEGSLIFK
ncbi:MAG: hypothetical protein PHQ34_01915 [Methanothrix sp.]|nr:hypothetical protein [Methanothrix sp.]